MSDDPLLDDLTNPGTPWHKKAYAVLRWLEGVRDSPHIIQSDYDFRYAHPAWPYVMRLLDEYTLLPNQAPSAGSIVGAHMDYPDSVIADPNQPLIHRMYTLLRWLEGDRLNPSILPPTQQAYDFYTGVIIPPAQEGGEPFRYGHRAWHMARELLDEYDREQRHPGTPTIPTTIYVLYTDQHTRPMGYYTDEGAARSDGTNHALDNYGRKQVGDWVQSPAPNVPAPIPIKPGEPRADGDSWWMPIYEATPHGRGKTIDHYRVGPYKLFQGTAYGLEGFGGS